MKLQHDSNNSQHNQRHTAAHILIQALIRLYPDTIPGVGPALEEGFYHDFSSSHAVSDADFPAIEAEIKKIIAENLAIVGEKKSIDEGIAWLADKKYRLTKELAENLKAEGETEISFYGQGEFTNMCRGGHLDSTGQVGVIKLMKVAGAYWLGDEKNEMLQRIYGVVFDTQAELDAYIHMLEEAKKRDHRKLGKELDLFVFSDLVGSGLPLFTPRGTVLRDELAAFAESLRHASGFQRVSIPHITKTDLYKVSGHWDKFGGELFLVTSQETNDQFALKPMNCPHHNQIYASQPRSYRDLPIKYFETTTVYRDEKAGELSGLSRVRSITQDDSHAYCRSDQISDVIGGLITDVQTLYGALGMPLRARLSYRDNSDAYLGEPQLWIEAQQTIRSLAEQNQLNFFEAEGEAAFYGPKIDFMATDALGREHQVATVQLDFVMPARFGLVFTNAEGKEEMPLMIHCALLGSIERFLSVYIEHTAGKFPLWLSPVQVNLLPVGENFVEGAQKIAEQFQAAGIRVEIDNSDNSVGKKIRAAEQSKVPYMIVIGEKEINGEPLQLRMRGSKETTPLSVQDCIKQLQEEITNRK